MLDELPNVGSAYLVFGGLSRLGQLSIIRADDISKLSALCLLAAILQGIVFSKIGATLLAGFSFVISQARQAHNACMRPRICTRPEIDLNS